MNSRGVTETEEVVVSRIVVSILRSLIMASSEEEK